MPKCCPIFENDGFFISNENVSDSMHFSSLINLLSCKSWKIAILMCGHEIYKSRHKICKKKFLSLTSKFFIKDDLIASEIHTKEQQKRKFKQIHPEIEDGIDLRRCPLICNILDSRGIFK